VCKKFFILVWQILTEYHTYIFCHSCIIRHWSADMNLLRLIGWRIYDRLINQSSDCLVVWLVGFFVCLSVTRVGQSKTGQAGITKFSPSAAQKTLVSGTVKLFHKFKRGHLEWGALNERGWGSFTIFSQYWNSCNGYGTRRHLPSSLNETSLCA